LPILSLSSDPTSPLSNRRSHCHHRQPTLGGESDKPIEADAYAIDRLADDVLTVAEAAEAKQVAVWGHSYGANVGRYLPTPSDRVTRLVIIGIAFGPATPGPFRDHAFMRTRLNLTVPPDARRDPCRSVAGKILGDRGAGGGIRFLTSSESSPDQK
jgi:pimeloyl-ACP methyl ester carboxylesterase